MTYRVKYSNEVDPFYRRMVVGDYNLFYSVNDQKKIVTVHRIFHHSRNVVWEMLI